MKQKFFNILRWIVILPGLGIVYSLVKFINNILSMYYIPDVINDMSVFGGFGGHYIFGPLYILQNEIVATAAAVYFVFKITPFKKELTTLLISIIWLIVIIAILGFVINNFIWLQSPIRGIIELVSMGFSIVIMNVVVFKKELK